MHKNKKRKESIKCPLVSNQETLTEKVLHQTITEERVRQIFEELFKMKHDASSQNTIALPIENKLPKEKESKESSILSESNAHIQFVKEQSSQQKPIRSIIPFTRIDILQELHKELTSIEYSFLEPCTFESFKPHFIKDCAPALERLQCLATQKDLVYLFHRFSMYKTIGEINNLPYTLTEHFVYKNYKTGKEKFLVERNLMSARTTIIKQIGEKTFNVKIEKLIRKVLGL
jgi:hypothetical protein